MFGFLKNLLRKSPDSPAEGRHSEPESPPQPANDSSAEAPQQTAASAQGFRAAPARKNLYQHNAKAIGVPLRSILEGLPLELQPRVRRPDVGDMAVSVPLEKILAQLARGAVKIYFGELRLAAPEVFSSETDRDRVLVSLPLSEILTRLNPALITRRRVQRQIEVPAEIASPFDLGTEAQIFNIGPAKAEPPPARNSAPAQRSAHPAPAPATPPRAPQVSTRNTTPPFAMPPSAPPRRSLTSVPTPPAPAAARPPAIAARPPAAAAHPPAAAAHPPAAAAHPPAAGAHPPAGAPASPAPIPLRPAPNRPAPSQPAAAPSRPAQVPRPVAQPKQAKPLKMVPSLPAEEQEAVASEAPVAAQPSAAPAAASNNGVEPLIVGLSLLAEAWPETVRKEIVDLRLVDAKVALPSNAIEQGLKQGRIAFSWKTIRFWIKPAVPATVSAHDGLVLELPLKVVAPLFLNRKHEHSKGQQKVAVDEEIPNLFFGFPKPDGAPAPATARPSDTNFYVWDDGAEMLRVDETGDKKNATPGTKFVAKYATPNEVVSRASGLDGVAGALIALPDGLMVANRLPPELNADTIAAFLPQIFGKVSQGTKELRMGELNNLNFTVGNIPWKIFRVHSIFFAAFGRAGEALPTAQLAALAAELDHKPK